jgi:fatty acid synthase, animal type
LKLASELEKEGKKGSITAIDGSPLLSRLMQAQSDKKDETEYGSYILTYILSLLYQTVEKSMTEEIVKCESWEDKLECFLELAADQKIYSKSYLRNVANSALNRAKIIKNTSDEQLDFIRLYSCTFIRPTQLTREHESECYNFDTFFEQKIDVINLEGNHQTVIDNPDLVIVLNKLHSKI